MKYNKEDGRPSGSDNFPLTQAGTSIANTGIPTQRITGSDVLKTAGYVTDLVQANSVADLGIYSRSIFLCKTANLALNYPNIDCPVNECMHYAVDAIKEIANARTTCSPQRMANARAAFALNVLIDCFVRK